MSQCWPRDAPYIWVSLRLSCLFTESDYRDKLNSVFPTHLSPKFPHVTLGVSLWVTKNEGVGLIVRAISFQDFQPMWSSSTKVTDRRNGTDGRTTCDRKTALCTIVHRAVKTEHKYFWKVYKAVFTVRCTMVQSAVLRLHVVHSVRLPVCLWRWWIRIT